MPRLLKHTARLCLTLLPVLVMLLHAGGWWRLEALERLEAMVYDMRLRAFMPRTLDERIAIVDLDEKSLAEVGQWPWSRHHLARLMDTLFEQQQIAALGMDVVFAEADASSGLAQLQALATGALRDQPGFAQQLATLAPQLDYDQRFAQALQNRPVVLGYYFKHDATARHSGSLPAPVLQQQALGERRFAVTQWSGYGGNIAPLAQAAPLAGFFNPVVDNDGVVRALPLLAQYGSGYYESLALGMFRLLLGLPAVAPGYPARSGVDYPYLESVQLQQDGNALAIPVDHRVATLVPYRGPGGPQGGSFRYWSASDVLQGHLPAGALQDKVVLLGTTAPGLMDMRATPVGEVYPGVETHANILSALLDGRLPVRPDYAQGYEMVALALLGLLLAVGLPLLSAWGGLALSSATGAALVGINLWLYQQHLLVLPLATLVLAVVLATALNMAYGYFVESRSKRELAHLFGTYVPPELVDEMVKDPDRYTMRATERELTVLFSDMRGFTHLSEAMTPVQTQQLLNNVFNRLTQEIRQRRGTIDKYMGDCVMAFWGAPVPTPDHARLAVEAALAMGRAIATLNDEHRQQGLPAIGMGVGLNTGTMCVGDMGSDLRRSYTVIGDAVNLGSRLEGVSKFYGVTVVASGATRAQAGEGFIWQELDKVKVKGKNEAVQIYTVRGTPDDLTPLLRDELAQWASFLQAWRAQQWVQAGALIRALAQQHQQQLLYALYQERVAARSAQPFDPNWDGSTQFETK